MAGSNFLMALAGGLQGYLEARQHAYDMNRVEKLRLEEQARQDKLRAEAEAREDARTKYSAISNQWGLMRTLAKQAYDSGRDPMPYLSKANELATQTGAFSQFATPLPMTTIEELKPTDREIMLDVSSSAQKGGWTQPDQVLNYATMKYGPETTSRIFGSAPAGVQVGGAPVQPSAPATEGLPSWLVNGPTGSLFTPAPVQEVQPDTPSVESEAAKVIRMNQPPVDPDLKYKVANAVATMTGYGMPGKSVDTLARYIDPNVPDVSGVTNPEKVANLQANTASKSAYAENMSEKTRLLPEQFRQKVEEANRRWELAEKNYRRGVAKDAETKEYHAASLALRERALEFRQASEDETFTLAQRQNMLRIAADLEGQAGTSWDEASKTNLRKSAAQFKKAAQSGNPADLGFKTGKTAAPQTQGGSPILRQAADMAAELESVGDARAQDVWKLVKLARAGLPLPGNKTLAQWVAALRKDLGH